MAATPSPWTETLRRQEVISAEEFRPVLEQAAARFLELGNSALDSSPEEWPQRRIYLLSRLSTDLETTLDDFGARESRSYHGIRELTAMIRWLSLAMGSLVHLDARLANYDVSDRRWSSEELAPQVRKSALTLGNMIQGCFKAFRHAWGDLDMAWPASGLEDDALEDPRPRQRLVRDLIEATDGEESGAQEDSSSALRLAARYLGTIDSLAGIGSRRREDVEAMRHFMATRCTEENARTHEARIHNLQSYYDSLVAGTPEERDLPDLRGLRGSISQAFHLLEAVTALSHLYERHDVYERRGSTRDLFESLVDEEVLLDIIINSCLVNAYVSIQRGRKVAEAVVASLTKQVSVDVDLPKGMTLHARPVSLIASVVQQHGMPVEAEIEGQRANAASIMQLLVLAGSNPGTEVIRFHGDESVLKDLKTLFEYRLGEDGLDRLPDVLDYLKP